jgi:hypothetical protein
MKEATRMSESITGAAAGAAGINALGGLAGIGAVGAGLAAIVVMSMTKPSDEREWRVALVSTVVSSIGGGAAVVQWLGLQHWAQNPFGLAGLFGLAFGCGLPGWALVRALFKYLDKRKDADIVDLVKEVKEAL